MKKTQTADERKTFDWIVHCSLKAPEGLSQLTCHSLVRLVRMRLGMTQKQLGERVGIPQSHIARIEMGKVDVQISTMKRLFHALHCRTLMIPKPVKEFADIIRDRAREVAERKIRKAVQGKMRELPESKIRRMIEAETEKLAQKPSARLWDK